jgi:hypothetical protein
MNCEHQGCKCQVEEGQQFCSDYCREHAGAGHEEHRCECGHPACADA